MGASNLSNKSTCQCQMKYLIKLGFSNRLPKGQDHRAPPSPKRLKARQSVINKPGKAIQGESGDSFHTTLGTFQKIGSP